MARRSLQASEQGIQAIKKALKQNKQSQTWLAGRLNCSRQTIWSLLNGKAIDCDLFMQACSELSLNWEDIAQPEAPEPEISEVDPTVALVQATRAKNRPQILEQCSTMRVLDMTQPIALTGEQGIYTSVNILEKLTGRQRLEIADLLKQCDTEEFDRFGLSRRTEERIPGLEAAERFPKMMVLGKPGAGKTTFLKYLAMQCMEGYFLPHHLPLFVTLKAFAENEQRLNLRQYLGDDAVTPILAAGKALILLDGLDEVREEDTGRVIQQIEQLSQQYPDNHFVITCRIAAKEYTFGQFSEVEVADFNDEQIDSFAQNWFRAKGDADRAKLFRTRLNENRPVKELASSPLLLTLLCLMFEDTTTFPANRSELYKEGLDVLLKKWDGKRKIERDSVYKNLSLKRKEDLLSQIAFATFERKEYFFKQRRLEDAITDFIRNLPDAKTDPEALHLDSEAVLKSIESHHGLLIERAKGVYSFSHLTFHEYFAAREIVESRDSALLQTLVSNITEKRWREVFLLTAGMVRNADELLQLMKQQTGELLAGDERLQEFLSWIQQKSNSVDAPYKPAAIRAFYLDLDLGSDFTLTLARALDQALESEVVRGRACALNLDLGLYFILALNLNLDHVLAGTLDSKLKLKLEELKKLLPEISENNQENFQQWWQTNGKAWKEQLRAMMIEHRNIGHDWQFSKAQQQLLWQYYNANKLLVDCLNLPDIYVSQNVREEIEATLLLPVVPPFS